MAESEERGSEEENPLIGSYNVNGSVLQSTLNDIPVKSNNETCIINDVMFKSNDKPSKESVPFELYATKIDESWYKFDYSDEDPAKVQFLKYSLETVAQGVIINNRLFLTYEQWNAIIPIGNIMYCMLCNVCVFDVQHRKGRLHLSRLKSYEPLEKFDLNLIRKIRNQYYCAICHEMFDLNDNDHCINVSHESNIVVAMKKAACLFRNNDSESDDSNECENENNNACEINDENEQQYESDNVGNAENYASESNDTTYELDDERSDVSDARSSSGDEGIAAATDGPETNDAPPYATVVKRSKVSDMLHCTICNVTISASYITDHVNDPNHLKQLMKALQLNAPATSQHPTSFLTPLNTRPRSITPETHQVSANANDNAPSEPSDSTGNEDPKVHEEDFHYTSKRSSSSSIASVDEEENAMFEVEVDSDVSSPSDSQDVVDLNAYVYVKVKNVYYRVTLSAYNTLVPLGDGSKFCFVCSVAVMMEGLPRHVDNRHHMENVERCRFMEKPNSLFRQLYLKYHCCFCNILVNSRDVKAHMDWAVHIEEMERSIVPKKTRRADFRSGVREITVVTQKEKYVQGRDSECRVLCNITLGPMRFEKKMKLVICSDYVLKIPWENWHGIVAENKCILCGDFEEVWEHVHSSEHTGNLEDIIESYGLHLMRKAKNNTLHCIICNKELTDSIYVIDQHIRNRFHKRYLDYMRDSKREEDGYADCDRDVITIKEGPGKLLT